MIERDQTCDTLYCDDPNKGCACDDKYQNIDGSVCHDNWPNNKWCSANPDLKACAWCKTHQSPTPIPPTPPPTIPICTADGRTVTQEGKGCSNYTKTKNDCPYHYSAKASNKPNVGLICKYNPTFGCKPDPNQPCILLPTPAPAPTPPTPKPINCVPQCPNWHDCPGKKECGQLVTEEDCNNTTGPGNWHDGRNAVWQLMYPKPDAKGKNWQYHMEYCMENYPMPSTCGKDNHYQACKWIPSPDTNIFNIENNS